MGDGRLGVGKGEACLQRRLRHSRAQGEVAEVVREAGQDVEDGPCRRDRMVRRDRVGVDIPQAFERMRQGVEPVAMVSPRGLPVISTGSTMAAFAMSVGRLQQVCAPPLRPRRSPMR